MLDAGEAMRKLDEFSAAMRRSADLNAQAVRLLEGHPPGPGAAVLAAGLRENRDELRATALILASFWDDAMTALAARNAELSRDAAPPPALRLVVNG